MTTPGASARPLRVLFTQPVLIALAALAGALYAHALLGPALDPTNLSWLEGDPATAQVGWEFLRRSQDYWPLTFLKDLGYPFGTSIAFLDPIPLLAVALRPFSSWLPVDFQYLGLAIILNLSLQAYFAVRLFRSVFGDDPAVVFIGAAFVVLAPPLAWRTMAHFALSSHWLIVAALSYYFDDPQARGIRRYLLPFFVLAAVAGSINPYITIMTLFVAAAALLRLVLRDLLPRLMAVGVFAALTVTAACTLALFGFFARKGGYAGPGYGYFSMNLLSLIDPQGYPSLLLPQQRIGPGQYEGYNYLGLGVIAMLVVGLALQFRILHGLKKPDVLPLAVLYLLCATLAVSLTVTLGPWLIIKIGQGPLKGILSSFRATGRLFWPAYYLLIVAAFVLICRLVPGRFRLPVLGAFLVLQIADTQSLRTYLRTYFQSAATPGKLEHPAWLTLGQHHRHLVVVPPWQCDTGYDAMRTNKFYRLPMLAARQGMTVNSYYAGRNDPEQQKYFCSTMDRLRRDGLDPDTAYAFSPATYEELFAAGAPPRHVCQLADNLQLCVRKPSG